MTEHKFTDDEVIRALECCKSGYCIARNCPFYDATEDDDIGACTSRLSSNALDLINRQKAEIERLQKSIELMKGAKCVYSYDGETLEYCISSPCPISKTVDQIKAEAIKEFAERLKYTLCVNNEENTEIFDYAYTLETIDNLVKEMTEGTKVSPHEICVVCGDQVPEGRQVCYMCENSQEFLNKKKE